MDLKSPRLSVEMLLDELEPEARAALNDGLRNMELSVFEIAAACRDDGFDLSPRAFQGWRVNHMSELA